MKKALFLIGSVALLLVIGALYYIPLSEPKEVCRALVQWDGGAAGWRLDHPMDLAWGGGFLYVADTENGAVKKFRDDGTLVAEWKGFKRPVDVAIFGDAIYVADFLTDRIVRLRSDGTVTAEWGRYGTGAGQLDAPSGIAVDGDGNVYVAEFYNHRISKFTADGKFVARWGKDGRWNGQFHYPTDVTVAPDGTVFVADAYNQRIQRFTAQGIYLGKWGGIGYGISGPWLGWFRLAKAVAVDATGHVYVADAFNRRIQKFSSAGDVLGVWAKDRPDEPQELNYAAGVAVGADGIVYVSDFFENRILKLDCR